jgi:hypothetical protein
MRMMMKVQIPVAAGNAAIASGTLPIVVQKAMEQLKPEAAYFFAEGGMRTSLFVFEMADSSQIPPDIEPLFQMLEASVDLRPVMNAEELQAGLGQLG